MPSPVYDTMLADQVLHERGYGRSLSDLADEYLGIDLPKDEQVSSWSQDHMENLKGPRWRDRNERARPTTRSTPATIPTESLTRTRPVYRDTVFGPDLPGPETGIQLLRSETLPRATLGRTPHRLVPKSRRTLARFPYADDFTVPGGEASESGGAPRANKTRGTRAPPWVAGPDFISGLR